MKFKNLICIAAILTCISLSSCKTGNFSIVNGKDDKSFVYFASDSEYAGKEVIVYIDNNTPFTYKVLKSKNGKIKNNAKPQSIAPGRHIIKVSCNDKPIHNSEIFVSTQTSKIINL